MSSIGLSLKKKLQLFQLFFQKKALIFPIVLNLAGQHSTHKYIMMK